VGVREAGAGGLDLVGMDRQDLQARGRQALDQGSVGSLDRHPDDAEPTQPADQLGDPVLAVGEVLL
jgi:hypothetical protein